MGGWEGGGGAAEGRSTQSIQASVIKTLNTLLHSLTSLTLSHS